jgi:hypothetical protein
MMKKQKGEGTCQDIYRQQNAPRFSSYFLDFFFILAICLVMGHQGFVELLTIIQNRRWNELETK